MNFPSLVNIARIALLLLSAGGGYFTWYMLLNNGTTEYMSHIRDFGPRLVPGTKEPLKTEYIGISAVDYQLTVLDLFFWELVDGSLPNASLFCYHFATQVACGWGLLMIETLRSSNKMRIISFLGCWGVLVQNLAYAVIVPLYLIVHLTTSPTLSSPAIAHIFVNEFDVMTIAIALVVGYAVPTVMMSLRAPSAISFERKQTYMAIWQMFPLWVSLAQGFTSSTLKFIRRKPPSQASKQQALTPSRVLYTGLILIAGVGQVSTEALLFTSKMFPNLFNTSYRGVFNPSSVFLPAARSPSTKMPSIGSGAFLLLQYDELIGSGAMLLWALALFFNVYKTTSWSYSPSILCLGATVTFVLTGPLGLATACMWARDELVFAEDEKLEKKKGCESSSD